MTRPPDPPRDHELDQGTLIELPVADERCPVPGARLAQEPAELGAWLEHADDPALADRLAELAQELAEGPRPAARPHRRWIPWTAAAAALLLIGATAAGLWPRAEPEAPAEPVTQLPAPAPPPVAHRPTQTPEPAPTVASLEPAPTPTAPPTPRSIARSFQSSDPTQPFTVVPGVEVQLDGQLDLHGTARAPRLHLRGAAVIDVVPGSVESLELSSLAAWVQVLGTRFAVEEGAEETTVRVERGEVAVRCEAGQEGTLGQGQDIRCPNANGLLIQAKLARMKGEAPDDVLPLVEAGLQFPDFALRERLEVMRMELLLELDREAEAREAIQSYLQRQQIQHRDEVQQLAERLSPQG